MGDMSAQIPNPKEVLKLIAQGREMEQEDPQRATELLAASTVAFSGEEEVQEEKANEEEEEEESLLKGDLRWTSSQMGATPWRHLLNLYKQFQKSAMTKFSYQEDLSDEEKGEEVEEEDSSAKLCDTHIATSQSPPQRTFMSTESLGFGKSELKKLPAVPRESPLWNVDSPKDQELQVQSEVTRKESDMVKIWCQQAEGEEGCPPTFAEYWRLEGGRLKLDPPPEGRVLSTLCEASRNEPLFVEELEEVEN
ncbi:PREDICTED: gametogenetin-binding protein 1-like [Dipodomys ordii]|uniref:Gametogenetin-binding protein 1-like n=1 Tax=Dipodomys ordii TaxID=10020 RepID=A0A1S3GQ52_DIPOR|nr:PREDICTED: gametogenetin-binding protein 1-like [Dipodomys ordii]